MASDNDNTGDSHTHRQSPRHGRIIPSAMGRVCCQCHIRHHASLLQLPAPQRDSSHGVGTRQLLRLQPEKDALLDAPQYHFLVDDGHLCAHTDIQPRMDSQNLLRFFIRDHICHMVQFFPLCHIQRVETRNRGRTKRDGGTTGNITGPGAGQTSSVRRSQGPFRKSRSEMDFRQGLSAAGHHQSGSRKGNAATPLSTDGMGAKSRV